MKIETAAQREEKVRDLMRRISKLCADVYAGLSGDDKETLSALLAQLESVIIDYRNHKTVWDSQLIDIVSTIKSGEDSIQVKSKGFSTFESVMDKAREVFTFVSMEQS